MDKQMAKLNLQRAIEASRNQLSDSQVVEILKNAIIGINSQAHPMSGAGEL